MILRTMVLGAILVMSVTTASAGEVTKREFGRTPEGATVDQYTLKNKNGLLARVMTYGATLTELHVPDRNGKLGDIVLGFETFEPYAKGHPLFGSIAGRFANRIAGGRFILDGKEYRLAVNNGPNTLHGGLKGFDKKVWKARILKPANGAAVEFRYVSPHLEENFPGKLDVRVVYSLTDANELEIAYEAKTDRPTVVNLTNHSYYNLADSGNVHDHELLMNARWYTLLDENTSPTGEVKFVDGTPFDFRKPRKIGERIGELESTTRGYDHNFVLDGAQGADKLMAQIYEPRSGRMMEVRTTEPGVQLYTANFLDGSLVGKGGIRYAKHGAFCLEAQHFPDAPNKPHFPSTVLRPGETYRQRTVHRFSTR